MKTTIDKNPIKIIGAWDEYEVDALVNIETEKVSSGQKDRFGRIMKIPYYGFTYKDDKDKILTTPYYKVIQSFKLWVEQFDISWEESQKNGANFSQECAERMFVMLSRQYYKNFLQNKTTTFNDAFGRLWFKGVKLEA